MAVVIVGTGARIRQATEAETRAVERTRLGRAFELDPPRSSSFVEPSPMDELGGIYVVGQAFVEFAGEEPWRAMEHHGHRLPRTRDATIELLDLADEVIGEGLMDLLAEMGIAGLGVSRWDLMSAPRRLELAPELEAQLAPLRRR